MMVTIYELINSGQLQRMLDKGYIRKQVHPSEPLAIFNYTQQAVFAQDWCPATRICRGLIVNTETDEVVARPFPKFFNWNEPFAPAIPPDARVFVTDKLDGSLGIRYWAPNAKRWCIATRGSFTSRQAVHATDKLDELYEGYHEKQWHDTEYTDLFEIIYPENRIVINYSDLDSLVALGSVHIPTGEIHPVNSMNALMYAETGIPAATVLGDPYDGFTFADALAMKPRPNAEGIVVVTVDSPQQMVKIKQDDYIALHRTITGLNDRVIWERLRAGDGIADIKYGVPEEFWPYIEQTANELLAKHRDIIRKAIRIHRAIILSLEVTPGPGRWERVDYAIHAKRFDCRSLLFSLLDGRDIGDVVWKQIMPPAAGGLFQRNEDA